ncbi:uncharacterized protein TM35_000074550 [Trypanosoma theileri]|uniref:SAM domain-containing protein n=1 Tax=Trypanosoma theileri TaxID=67003 RepID=A0A1X0P2D7_9TRYP|nr:uncharacterized protein TM35_000074550 [Trypanosoma theileri]ORC91031.1 hypothetical protein TM35_000074550 [Trypanosoma theileri]
MRVFSVVLLLLLFSLCTHSSVAVINAASVVGEQHQHQQQQQEGLNDVKPVTIPLSPIVNKPVEKWTVSDVEYWMNYTVGYAEYSGFVRKHGVDGPTLLAMDGSDFEEHFPIENAMHAIKLSAHLKLLQGLCLCKTDDASMEKVVDLWSYFKKENFRVWVVGITSFFFPRLSMLYTFFFDDELYRMLLGVPSSPSSAMTAAAAAAGVGTPTAGGKGGEYDTLLTTPSVPFMRTLLYLICLIFAPDLFLMVEAARLVPTNYIIMPCCVLLFLLNAYREYLFFYFTYKGSVFSPDTPLYKKIWFVYSYTLFVPPILFILYPIVPFTLQCILLFLLPVGFILVFIAHIFIPLDPSSEEGFQKGSENEKSD